MIVKINDGGDDRGVPTDYVYDDENGLDDVGGEVQCVTFISKNLLIVPTLPCEPEVAVGRCIRAASEMKL
jgi:hypothetical protein